jgi:TorA maturation chaperone TorD
MTKGMGTSNHLPHDRRMAVNKDRYRVYVFLSKLYEREVSLELLKDLSGENSPFGTSGELGDEGLLKGFQLMSKYIKDAKGRDLNQVRLELAVEYANLFLGFRAKPSHPSESVYLSEDHTMYQEPRDRVLRTYRNAGVDKAKEYAEPEDHIAIELQFMAYLCRKTVEAIERSEKAEEKKLLQIQREFLNDHLAKWVPRLTRDILETAGIDFYKGLAYVTDAFVELDRDSIPHLIEESNR